MVPQVFVVFKDERNKAKLFNFLPSPLVGDSMIHSSKHDGSMRDARIIGKEVSMHFRKPDRMLVTLIYVV